MKIYTAAAWVWRDHARELAKAITAAGHEVTSQWLNELDGTSEAEAAAIDLQDIDRADILVLLTMAKGAMFSSGGRMVEIGYAMAKGKVVAIIGERENVFCYLPQVLQFDYAADFILALQQMEVGACTLNPRLFCRRSSPSIVIHMDYVVVEGVRVDRPSRLSRSQWVDFWEDAISAV